MSNDINLDEFMSDLTASTANAGSLKMWRFNATKLAAHKDDAMRLPLQARVCIKAAYSLAHASDQADFSMTVPMIADRAKELGLETRQEANRIVRYYMASLKKVCLDPVK
jgi:hypothetical protein